MAFANRFGNLFKQAVKSSPSIYQAIRCMSSSRLFIGGLLNNFHNSLYHLFWSHDYNTWKCLFLLFCLFFRDSHMVQMISPWEKHLLAMVKLLKVNIFCNRNICIIRPLCCAKNFEFSYTFYFCSKEKVVGPEDSVL